MSQPQISDIAGNPTDEEVVAIVSAIELAWPKPAISARVTPSGAAPWRFSGRWWATPLNSVRTRP